MNLANVASLSNHRGVIIKIENARGVVWAKNVEPPEPQLKGNLVPTSIDTSGNVYNGVGYMDGQRMNSSGNQVAYSGVAITGHIPCDGISDADTIYIGGVEVISDVYCGITFYDASFNVVYTLRLGTNSVSAYDINTDIVHTSGTTLTTGSNGITVLDINFNETNYAKAPPKYFRIFAKGSGANMDVRINEEIT